MRGLVLVRAAALALLVASLAEPAAAQRPQSAPQYQPSPQPRYQQPGPIQPGQVQPFSVDGQLQRYSRQPALPDPIRDREAAERERLRRLGLPYYDPEAAKAATKTAPGAAPGGIGATASPNQSPTLRDLDRNYSRHDSNRDGVISRGEYLNSRARVTPPAARNTFRDRIFQDRAASRFRANDRNGDGRLSPDELQDLRNPRF